MVDTSGALFQPFSHKSLKLANRVIMAPMTRRFSPGGIPGPDVAAYYRRRAEGGVGLILTEGVAIDHPSAVYDPAIPFFYGQEALSAWTGILADAHRQGTLLMPQLWHTGGFRRLGNSPYPDVPPVTPSGLYDPDTVVGAPMTEVQIADIIAAYGRSAAHAHRLGFDGVEIHGAHGYLIDSFFWDAVNRRTDRYNGDLVARTRFATEVIREVRRATSPRFPILFRFSQWKQQDYSVRLATTPQALERFLAPIVEAGVDILHCSTRRFWQPEFEGSELNLAGWTRKLTGLPTITVGSVGLSGDARDTFSGATAGVDGLDRLMAMLERGDFDLVAVGRALLGDPDWVRKVREGRHAELQAFSPEALKSLS